MKANKWIINNIGLKILSLILAVITWFYINYELTKMRVEEEKAIISMLQYDVVSKRLPIQLTIVGKMREGYMLLKDNITIEPESYVVIGPEKILEDVAVVKTLPVDITEYTKDVTKQIGLAPIARGIKLDDEFVKIYIPIIKIKNQPDE